MCGVCVDLASIPTGPIVLHCLIPLVNSAKYFPFLAVTQSSILVTGGFPPNEIFEHILEVRAQLFGAFKQRKCFVSGRPLLEA